MDNMLKRTLLQHAILLSCLTGGTCSLSNLGCAANDASEPGAMGGSGGSSGSSAVATSGATGTSGGNRTSGGSGAATGTSGGSDGGQPVGTGGGGSAGASAGGSPSTVGTTTYLAGEIPKAAYIGRWETKDVPPDGSFDVSHYLGSMIKVKFAGTTAKLKVALGTDWDSTLYYKIDDGPLTKVTDFGGKSPYDLTPTPLSDGVHDLMIANGDASNFSENENLYTAELVLDPGKETAPPDLGKHIEFIGDSITAGWGLTDRVFDGYGWLVAEELGLEHTNIAESGIGLAAMHNQYFGATGPADGKPWDVSASYKPDFIFINLGQNDGYGSDGWGNTYKKFLVDLRAAYPEAVIFPFAIFNSSYNPTIKAQLDRIVSELNDPKIEVVDGQGWLTNGSDNDYLDSVELHPNKSGNRKAADRIKPIVQKYL